MRLGYIDYLNCYPFYFHMFEREPVGGVQVIPGYPSDLNRMMAAGELDMSPISSATYAEISGSVRLVPHFCLSSVGYVGSVVLRSRVPIEALDRRTVGITRASHTSAVLLQVLLSRYYEITPTYVATDPNPSMDGMDAALLIGNEAMIAGSEPVSYSYDLGELWLRKTGFPVIFAMFAVREEAVERHPREVAAVIRSYGESLRCLQKEKASVIAAARRRYPDIMYDIHAYYNALRFEFTNRLREGLRFYLDTAAEAGVLTTGCHLRFLE